MSTEPLRLDRAVLRIAGPDAHTWLQSLLTQDLDALATRDAIYAALLGPQGKVVADLMARAEGDAILVDLDPARSDEVLRRLQLYKLRAAVSIEEVSSVYVVLFSPAPFEGAAPDPRFPDGALGWRRLAPSGGGWASGEAAYQKLRLRAGAPDLARDAGVEEVFALEALLEELHGVDFQKGCFVGQENVSRMKRRATTRRKFCPVAFEGDAPAYAAPILAGEAQLGEIRSGGEGRAIALLRLDRALDAVAAGQELTVDGRTVRLAAPPWLLAPRRDA